MTATHFAVAATHFLVAATHFAVILAPSEVTSAQFEFNLAGFTEMNIIDYIKNITLILVFQNTEYFVSPIFGFDSSSEHFFFAKFMSNGRSA